MYMCWYIPYPISALDLQQTGGTSAEKYISDRAEQIRAGSCDITPIQRE